MPWWTIFFWTMLVVAVAYAFVRGGGIHRAAAASLLVGAVGTVLVRSRWNTRYSSVETGVLVIDCLLFAVLLVVAVRSGRGWAIALAVLQAVTLLGHLGKRLEPDLWRLGYAIMVTAPAYPGLLALTIGTLQYRRMRKSMSSAASPGPC